MAVSENSKENLTEGNPTGALSKTKLERMKHMAAFGESVSKDVDQALINGLKDPEKDLKSVEIILKYTCPVPKEVPDQKEGNFMNQLLVQQYVDMQQKIAELKKENETLKQSLVASS